MFRGFRYRFFSEHDLVRLLAGIGGVLRRRGSLSACFRAHQTDTDMNTMPALIGFVREIEAEAGGPLKMLADPARGSACKRLHLYLRWMIRNDQVDPGTWPGLSSALLIVPMDVHMHRIGTQMGFVTRGQPDLKAALEATEYFRSIRPDDPVRYDFCLTRMGIHPDLSAQPLPTLD